MEPIVPGVRLRCMRQPITVFARTREQFDSARLSYQRPDVAFFSAGACQILAFAFLETYPHAGFRPRFIYPTPGFDGSHVYVTDGHTAFDAQGYVSEVGLLRRHHAAYAPYWQGGVEDITVPMAEFCAANDHAAPCYFPPGAWERALAYLRQFPAPQSALALSRN